MSAKLHPINHDHRANLWCGPAALATVTGRSTSECFSLLLQIRCGRPVKGVYDWELRKAFELLGYRVESVPAYRDGKVTLARWCKHNKEAFAEQPVVVVAGNHFMVLLGRKVCDSWSKRPIFIGDADHRRARVTAAFRVVRVGESTWTPPAKPVRDYAAEKARRGVLTLAAQYGITIEDHNPGEWWVYPPPGFESQAKDPYWDDHLAFDANERAERVRTYVALVRTLSRPEEVAA